MSVFTVLDERFRTLTQANAQIETCAQGLRWAEGPVWFGDHDCLYFSDIPNDRIMRWREGEGASVFRSHAGYPNGHARDRQGRLLSCLHHRRAVTRTEFGGEETVLAERFSGGRLNSPNDIVVSRDGAIWFTDPPYGIQTDYEGGKQHQELPSTIYRICPNSGEIASVSDEFTGPNGLAFSPDEDILYVSETGDQFASHPHRAVYRMTMGTDGLPGPRQPLLALSPGYIDGFKVDIHGNIWASSDEGVHVFTAQGTLIGKVETGCHVSNLCFGGRGNARLFMAAGDRVLSVFTNSRGAVSV